MKFCSVCEEEFADKFSFCPVDGTPLSVVTPKVEEPSVTVASDPSVTISSDQKPRIEVPFNQANVPADLEGGHEEPVEETPAGLVWQTQRPILVSDLAEERRWPLVCQRMKEDGTNSCCIVPLTTAVRRLGAGVE